MDPAANELGKRLLRNALDDFGQQEVIDVAVDEAPSGRLRQHFFGGAPDRLVSSPPLVGDVDVRPQPRHVRQQVADGDAVLSVFSKLRNECRDRIGEADPAVFNQRHHGRSRRDDLGQRREVEDRVERHGLDRWLHGAIAVRAPEHDGVSPADDHDGAGCLFGCDRLVDDGIQPIEPRQIEAGASAGGARAARLWRRGRLCGQHCQRRHKGGAQRRKKTNGTLHGRQDYIDHSRNGTVDQLKPADCACISRLSSTAYEGACFRDLGSAW